MKKPQKRIGALLALLVLLLAGQMSPTRAQSSYIETQTMPAGVPALGSAGTSVAATDTVMAVGAPQTNNGRGSVTVFVRNNAAWTQQATLTASDAVDFDQFGWSVAMAGNTIAVGAYGRGSYRGAVYIFTSSSGIWSQRARITANDGVANDGFGYSVSLSGTTLAVGAPWKNVSGATYQGATYVYTGSGTTWTRQARLVAANVASDQFGYSVSINNNTLAVGAPTYGRGYVNIFTRSGTTWTRAATLIGDTGTTDGFGYSVALRGGTVVIGAAFEQVGTNPYQGAAYVFTGSGGAWTRQVRWTEPGGAAYTYFGYSVGFNGIYAAIGSPYSTVNGQGYRGCVWLGRLDRGEWDLWQQLTARNGNWNHFFGTSVAFSGSTLAIGAPGVPGGGSGYAFRVGGPPAAQFGSVNASGTNFAISGNTIAVGDPNYVPDSNYNQRGGVHIYTRAGTTSPWVYQRTLMLTTPAAFDRFGEAVAMSGNTLIVGCPNRDNGTSWDQGAAYVYTVSGTTWTLQKTLRPADGSTYRYFGSSVALDGNTAVVGAPTYGTSVSQQSVYAFLRSGTTWTQQAKMDTRGSVFSLAVQGDTVAVGLPNTDNGSNYQQGRVEIWNRASGAWSRTNTLLDVYYGRSFDNFGSSVSLNGDVLAVGAPGRSEYYNDRQGAVYLYSNAPGYWTSIGYLLSPDGIYTSPSQPDKFGAAVAVSGNALAIGAPGVIGSLDFNAGAVYLYNRNTTTGGNQFGFQARARWWTEDGGQQFGSALAYSGTTLGIAVYGGAWVSTLP